MSIFLRKTSMIHLNGAPNTTLKSILMWCLLFSISFTILWPSTLLPIFKEISSILGWINASDRTSLSVRWRVILSFFKVDAFSIKCVHFGKSSASVSSSTIFRNVTFSGKYLSAEFWGFSNVQNEFGCFSKSFPSSPNWAFDWLKIGEFSVKYGAIALFESAWSIHTTMIHLSLAELLQWILNTPNVEIHHCVRLNSAHLDSSHPELSGAASETFHSNCFQFWPIHWTVQSTKGFPNF